MDLSTDLSTTDLRAASARLSPTTVRSAVQSLLKWKATKSQSENLQLLADEDYLYLNLTLKKIPPKTRVNPYKLPLPHPLHNLPQTELCLIIDDREKSKLTKADAKKKVEEDDIGVGKILKLSKLRTDYRSHEGKRKLCDSYDMFLADKRIIPLLPRLLGKHFYKKKKIPVPVDLRHKNWKEQIHRAIGSGLVYLRTGTCSVVKVARAEMEVEEIVENVMAAVNGIVEIVPKKWDGIRSFHLKLNGSVSLPVYQALPDLKLKIEGAVKDVEDEVEDAGEVTDDVKSEGDGEVQKKKKGLKKGRIREVRYMDVDVDLVGGSVVDNLHANDVDDHSEADNTETAEAADEEEVTPVKKRKNDNSKLDKAADGKRLKKETKPLKGDLAEEKKKKGGSKLEKEDAGKKKLKKEATSVKEDGAVLKEKTGAGEKKLKKETTSVKVDGTALNKKTDAGDKKLNAKRTSVKVVDTKQKTNTGSLKIEKGAAAKKSKDVAGAAAVEKPNVSAKKPFQENKVAAKKTALKKPIADSSNVKAKRKKAV